MSTLVSEPPEVSFTVTIKRAVTGIEETYNMIGHVLSSPEPQQTKEQKNGCNPLDSGT